jgi:hypothetical protein
MPKIVIMPTGATEILTGIGPGVDMRILYEYWYTAAEGVYVPEDAPWRGPG